MTVAIQTTANAVWTATMDWVTVPNAVRAFIGTDLLGVATITEPEAAEQNDTYTIALGMEIPFTINPAGVAAGMADAAFIELLGTGNINLALYRGNTEVLARDNAGYARVTVAYKTVQK